MIARLALLFALPACSPGAVVTVQPNAIPKSAFEGEWYWRRTIEEVPYGTAVSFVGAQDALERVRFDVEEDRLVVRRATPVVDDAGAEPGAPLLVFPITDQFDIRRAYDPTTGEESNVVQEDRERPWYDRDFVRVDFSTDLSGAPFDLAGTALTVSAWVQGDDRRADAPQLDDSDGDGTIDSLIVTQHALAAPDLTTIPGWGDVPTCFLYGEAEHDCEPAELGVLHSFVRLGDRAPYAGEVQDDERMSTFGYFTSDRLAYDRDYGLLEPNHVRWTNRHPIWAASYRTDDRGQVLCRAHHEQRPCGEWSAADSPTPVELPYSERTIRPIVYHAGPDLPADLSDVVADAVAEWNEPLRDAVNGARVWECLDDGGSERACAALVDPDLEIFRFCPHNPSVAGDPEWCSTDHTGPEGRPDGVGDPIRIGDLRYHLVEVVPDPALSSPFGYGPSAADPTGTRIPLADGRILELGGGEIVSANAFVYGYVLDRVATQVADLVALLNGDIAPDAFAEGADVTAWLEAVRAGDTAAFVGTTDGVGPWTEDQVRARAAEISNGFAPVIRPLTSQLPRPRSPAELRAFLEAGDGALAASGVFGAGAAQLGAAWDGMVGSEAAQLAWSPDAVAALGYAPATDPDALGATPFDLVSADEAARRHAGRVTAGEHALDLDDGAFTDSTLLGLARDYARRGLSREEILVDVRHHVFREVLSHELGHTLGLRHNFAGSTDAFNYRPEYWALRQDGAMGPRHVDPETRAEVDGRIREVQYSTVMDYPGARNVGWAGLGHYDRAAIKFGYGRLVEVLTAVPTTAVVPGLPNDTAIAYQAAYASSTVLPSPLLFANDGSMPAIHYTDWPAIAGDLEARTDVPYRHLHPTIEASGGFTDGLETDATAAGPAGLPAVPYRFCSDEFAVGINCARFDEGADPYEQISFLLERYWNDYLLTNFARQRYGFGDSAVYVGRLQDRTFEPLHDWLRYYALFHGLFDADHDPGYAAFLVDDRGWGGWTAATDESLRFLMQVVTRPEPGPHAAVVRPDGTTALAPVYSGGDAEIDLVAGAWFESEWDQDGGYHWYERQERIGTYYDRMLALLALTNTASTGFLGYDTAIDPRKYALGFQDLYRDPLHRWLAALASDRVDLLAPARTADGTLVYPDPLRPDRPWPPADTELVEPATYWLVRYDAALLGTTLLEHGYDRSFLDRARLYVEGSSDAVTPPPGTETVSYTDPEGGGTFTAWSFPMTDASGDPLLRRGEPVELGLGAAMVRRTRHLADLCEGAVVPDGVDPADPDAVALARDAACVERRQALADLDLTVSLLAEAQDRR